MKVLINIYRFLKKIYDELLFIVLGSPFRKNLKQYNKNNKYENFKYNRKYRYPILFDRYMQAGSTGSYFWQDLWAASLVSSSSPKEHYDIGSRIDGFISHLACHMKNIYLIDIRPLDVTIPNVKFVQDDATSLQNIKSNSISSLSALCSLEHFGLGRYGDPVDPDACFKCFKAIQRVMKKKGKLYISVPIGKEHLEFDAHRVFYASTIINAFDEMKLIEFSAVDASCKGINRNIDIHYYDNYDKKGGSVFGLFVFEKK